MDTDIYGAVRRPVCLSFILVKLALIFIAQHWLIFALDVPIIAFLSFSMWWEDRGNIEKYGEHYLDYYKECAQGEFREGDPSAVGEKM